MSHVLVVDDERDTAATMAMLIAGEGYTVATAGSLHDARRQMALQTPDLVFLDLMLPDGSGMRLLEDNPLGAESGIVLMTGHADVESSVQALRLGAVDYLLKPVAPRQLQEVLTRVAPAPGRHGAVRAPTAATASGHRFGRLLGRSKPMRVVFQQIERVAPTGVSVLLTGESGSGKELAASTLHEMSSRRDHPFLAVNCGAISPNLMESELFGHEKGSFTGADREHAGLFERAHGGTLFLDEITEMPLELQVKLLRVLETGSFLRVGASQLRHCDVRLVAATNRDPQRAVDEGKLREDLFYRLNVFPILLPPLRARRDDIALLADHFLEAIGRQEGVAKEASREVLAQWNAYDWPGNVRELGNMVERALILSGGAALDLAHFPIDAERSRPAGRDVATPAAETDLRLDPAVEALEVRLITAALQAAGGNKSRAAQLLQISERSVWYKIKKYGLA
jgi:DNA-binding NtrC family response regulator